MSIGVSPESTRCHARIAPERGYHPSWPSVSNARAASGSRVRQQMATGGPHVDPARMGARHPGGTVAPVVADLRILSWGHPDLL